MIEEARARQRVHRCIAALASIAAAGFAVIGVALAGGFGSPHPQTSNFHGHPSRIAPVALASCGRAKSTGRTVQGPPSQALLSILGALRRPATAADALPASALSHLIGSEFGPARTIYINYVRRVRVVAGVSYWIFPEIVTFCGHSRESMAEWESGGPVGGSGGGGLGNATTIEEGQVGATLGSFGTTKVEMLVPDGVAAVTLRYPAGKIGGFDRHHAPATTITTRVIDNVLIVNVPRGGDRLIAPMTMTWRAANGHAVKTFDHL